MSFAISINPLYKCSFRCTFCYLTPDQLKSDDLLSLTELDQRLSEVSKYRTITHIDLYGGEVALLPQEYVIDMFNVIRKYYQGSISVITNLFQVPDWFMWDDVDLSVSWDYTAREHYMTVLRNMVLLNKDFHVLMLVGKEMVDWDIQTLIVVELMLNQLHHLVSMEFKPYSTNQANQDDVSFKDYEDFIQRWMEVNPSTDHRYEFVTENKIKEVLDGNGHAWSDDHIYITPTGLFAVLDFDWGDREGFSHIYDFVDYIKWTRDETLIVNSNAYCGTCEFKGKCLSEHLRIVTDIKTQSCSGFKGLLEWYRSTK